MIYRLAAGLTDDQSSALWDHYAPFIKRRTLILEELTRNELHRELNTIATQMGGNPILDCRWVNISQS